MNGESQHRFITGKSRLTSSIAFCGDWLCGRGESSGWHFPWVYQGCHHSLPLQGRADTQRKWFNKTRMKFKWEILQLVLNNLMNQHRLGTNYLDSNSNEKRGQAGHKPVANPCRNKGYSLMGRYFGFTWHTWSTGHTLLGPPKEEQCWQTGGIETVQRQLGP